jgi:glucosyl-3-phosphoglycerate synthase
MQPRLTDDSGTTVGPVIEGIERRFPHQQFDPAVLTAAKAGRRISVCIPARNEAGTVGAVVDPVVSALTDRRGGVPLVDQVLVVDDGSQDATADVAAAAGAEVLSLHGSGGKGQAMWSALEACTGDLVVFLDADVENTTPEFVTSLVGPLLAFANVALVKGYYLRPFQGVPTGGGRVTELVARPLIELFFPALGDIRQPLAGETAAPRWVLEKFRFADGYGVELGLLVDVAREFGIESIAQVDLGTRIHRNRPLTELRPQATEIMTAAFDRLASDPRSHDDGTSEPPG